jgi:ribose transport system permease protein
MSGTARTLGGRFNARAPLDAVLDYARRDTWTFALLLVVAGLLLINLLFRRGYGTFELTSLAIFALPIAFAAVGQAIAVISGGIDLSIASVIALTNVIAASLLLGATTEMSVLIVLFVMFLGLLIGATNGALVVLTRVPDIVVTLAMLFVWGGAALLVLGTLTVWLISG